MILRLSSVPIRRLSMFIVAGSMWLSMSSTARPGEMRTWVDRSGKHRVEAEFVGLRDGNVTLRNSNGKEVTLPIARLSQPDQDFIRKLTAGSNGAATSAKPDTDPKAKPAAAKPLAKRFFTALIDENFDDLKTMLTPEGQANWDEAKSLLEDLDPPDDRKSILVRTAKDESDHVDVNVSVKVRGKYLKQRLQCRWSGEQWLVAGLITDGEEPDEIDFEKGRSEGGSSRDDDPDDEEDE